MELIGFYLKQVLAVVLSASLLSATVPPPSRDTIGASPVRLNKGIPALTGRPGLNKKIAAHSATVAIEPRLRSQLDSDGLSLVRRGPKAEGSNVPDNQKATTTGRTNDNAAKLQLAGKFAALDSHGLEFVENKGQFDARVKFRASNHGKTLWLTENGIVFDFFWDKPSQANSSTTEMQSPNRSLAVPRIAQSDRIEQLAPPSDMERHVISQEFVGTSKNLTIETSRAQQGAYNYFSGGDPSRWQTGVRRYSEIVYHDLWKGVDLRLYGNGPDLEQEFILQPGADIRHVEVAYKGIDGLDVDQDGSLLIKTATGQMRETAPRIYQEISGQRVSVEGSFELLSSTSYTFSIANHDTRYAMTIDPTLLYSTYLGGSAGNSFANGNGEVANAVAVDSSGNAYVTGYTLSPDFPTTAGAFQTAANPVAPYMGFVTKLNPTGSALVYSSYFNYTGQGATAIAVDTAGNAYIAGMVSSNADTSFPLTGNAYSSCGHSFFNGTSSAFLSVLNSNGSGLLYSTCFGALGSNEVTGVAIDSSGHAFVVGEVPPSGGIPTTPNAVQNSLPSPGPGSFGTAFVTGFDTNASGAASLYYSTYLGVTTVAYKGSAVSASAVAVDSFGKVYITGNAAENLPTTPGAFQPTFTVGATCSSPGIGSWPCPHAFVAKLDPTAPVGQTLIYSTYLEGSANDIGNAIAVDGSGNAFVAGTTQSMDFPVTHGAFQTTPPLVGGNTNVSFVARLNAAGSSLLYATYIEPVCAVQPCIQENVRASGIAVDALGNAYVTGSFRALIINLATTPDAFQNTYSKLSGDFSESFLMKLNATGSALLYGSYLGGEGDDVATAVAIDQTGDAYVVGHTSSLAFPVTPFAFQPSVHGTGDAFVTKLPLGTNQSLSVTGITPIAGGNSGTVSPQIFGTGFHAGATAQLNCGSAVVGTNVTVGPAGRFLNATFNLSGALPGGCDVVITNPNGTSATLSQAFSVQQGGAPNIQAYITGVVARKVPPEVQTGPANAVLVVTVSNTGNVNSIGGVISLPLSPPLVLTSTSPVGLSDSSGDFQVWPSVPIAAGSSQTVTATASTNVLTACDVAPVGAQMCFTPDNCHIDKAQFDVCIANDIIIHTGCHTFLDDCIVASGGVPLPFFACLITGGLCTAVARSIAQQCEARAETCVQGSPICISDQLPCVQPMDPNNLSGPPGVGSQRWLAGSQALSYIISFENLATAAVPAQQVVVTEPLGPNVNLSTLSLPIITVPNGSNVVQVPVPAGTFNPAANMNEFITNVDLRPTQSLLVNVDAKLNPATQTLTWTFTSIDPATGQPPLNPLIGFLPPGAGANVSFSVTPAQGLATGSQIAEQATIVFQGAGPMSTQVWTNTIDNTAPVSQVQPLPAAESSVNFTVQWAGADVGSGIQDFTIYVSDNGGPFTPFQTNTTATSATFMGQTGHTYGFYSIARDLVGNFEPPKTVAEATTIAGSNIDTIPPITTVAASPQPNAAGWNNSNVTVTLTAADNLGGSGIKQITYSSGGAQLIPATTVNGSSASFVISTEGISTVTFFSTDNAGNVEAPNTLIVRLDKTPPTITPVRTPPPNTNGWNNTSVTVSFQCADTLSGLGAGSPPAPTVFSTEGAGQSVTGTCADLAGNFVSATVSGINIDKTPPTITGLRTPPPNANGWNNTNVTVSFQCADSLSGLAAGSPPAPTTLSTEGAGQSVAGTCTDLAGNSAASTVSGINIDKTPPTVACSANPSVLWPPNNKLVPVNVSVSVTDSLSGSAGFTVVSVTSNEPDSGQRDIQGFAPGTASTSGQLRAQRLGSGTGRIYTFNYSGTDRAGNAASCTTTVTVPHDQGK